MADTRREWTLASFAVIAAGCVVVPVYPTSSARECAWVLGDSGARAVVCGDPDQAAKVAAVRDRLPALARDPQVRRLVQGVLDEANGHYPPVEQIKRFAILERDLTIDAGELTPTLKVNRADVGAGYAELLDSLYA